MKINLKHRGIASFSLGNVILHDDMVVIVTSVVAGAAVVYQLTDLETGKAASPTCGTLKGLWNKCCLSDDILLNVELNEVTQ